ncbi:hypothetical protein ACET3Z_005040 [Daucus carota]
MLSGSNDVLTTALETPEGSGRVRAVGSFVTPKVYFQLPRQRRVDITKSELLKRDKLMTEELEKAKQDLINTKTEMMSEIDKLKKMITAGIVYSPGLSDKGSSEPPKKQVAQVKPPSAKELVLEEDVDCVALDAPPPCKKDNKVAFGVVIPSEDGLCNKIHGRDMPIGCLRVSVDGLLPDSNKDALLPVPVPGEMELVTESVGSHVAWPENLITFPSVVGEAKELCRPQPKKDELKALQIKFTEAAPPENVPKRWRLLYKHVMTIMKETGVSVKIPCDRQVFGCDKKICLLQEELLALLQFNMVGQSAISAYMMNLYNDLCEAKELDTFGFFNPGLTYNINEDFKSYVVKRLREGPDRIYFIPHNTKAVKSFNAQTGRTSTMPKVKNLLGTPKQPSGYECAYAVMRYMKEIIEDKDFSFHKKWMSKSRKCYEMDELDEVRNEALGFIEQYI